MNYEEVARLGAWRTYELHAKLFGPEYWNDPIILRLMNESCKWIEAALDAREDSETANEFSSLVIRSRNWAEKGENA